ncbi:hypothetical protein BLA24_13880 [Streptomyces cinnamoneus]|uniref:Uncharacterized protein n=1 Tax=Streptomyces cinnamoneus TaxID=53446 RepID=A0A2G1XJL2_STRCJ|nr:hypothetical protein BLA24_13880 [Streptomyces cinnamoneus]PPT11758.1 hypothetical protein CYQ11_01575 [Streptomyces cinnamoneus]
MVVLALAALAVAFTTAFAFGRLVTWLTRGLPRVAGVLLSVLVTFASAYAVVWLTWPSYLSVLFMLLWWAGSLSGNVAAWLRRPAGRHA